MRSLTLYLTGLTLLAILTMILAAGPPPAVEDDLAKRRNLGKAFYENPTTQTESVAEFKKALDLAPNSNREKLNYGWRCCAPARCPKASRCLQEVQQKDPSLPHTWFNLGIYYKKNGEEDKAIAQFERLASSRPKSRSFTTSSVRSTAFPDATADAPREIRAGGPTGSAARRRALPALQHVPPGRPPAGCRRGARRFSSS